MGKPVSLLVGGLVPTIVVPVTPTYVVASLVTPLHVDTSVQGQGFQFALVVQALVQVRGIRTSL